jgi:predicted outer membrane repeat protein
MKKSIFFLTAAAVMLFSCEKEQDFTKVNQDVPEKTISFAVSHETDADASKTTIDSGGNVQWEAADKLGVVYDGGLVESSAAGAPGASASFTATIPGDKDALYLVYPSSITAGYESGSLKVTVPATQDGTFGSTAIQVAEYAQPTCSIKNLGGLLAITTTADVDEIVISSNNSTPLVGKATVSFTDGIPSVSSVESGSTSVTLSGLGGAGTYYVAVLPGSFDAGIYIELKKSGSAVGEKITGNTLNVVRRKIMKINVGDPGVIANKKFVTVAGAGLKDGSSWDNAMGSTEFYSFLINKSTDNTVFMAAGTYPTQAAAGCTFNAGITGLSIYGGYPSTATGTSLAGRDITTNRTILSGDQDNDGTGENRILITNNSNITAVLDGLEFRKAYASGNQGMGSALCINNCKTIKVVNCIFSDNTNVTTTKETETKAATGGGAVRAAAGTVIFKGCTFSNNTATVVSGGAMRVAGTANVTLDECVFSNNTATTNGGAIHMSKGTLIIHDSQFNNNTATTNGGAISITQQADCSVTMSGTSFYHNRAASSSGYCGGAIAIGPCTNSWDVGTSDVTLTNCYFEENEGHATDIVYDPETPTSLKTGIDESKASTGGAIFVEKNASVKLDHCWFYHNLCSKNGGAIRTKDATAVLYMNACSFYMNYSGASASTVQGTSGPIAMYNCVFYNNQNKSTSSPATIRSTNGEILMANTSLRLGSSYPGVVFSATENSVIVNSLFVNSGADSEPALKKAIAVASGKTVSSFGHNLHSGYNADGSSYGTIDQTNAMAGSDQEIGLDDFPSWVGTFDGIGYHLLKITKLPTTYYNADPAVDYRATPAEVEAAIEYFDTNNSTAFKTWLNTLDEGSGRKPLDVDYRGYLRNATNIWPGSYEYGATK